VLLSQVRVFRAKEGDGETPTLFGFEKERSKGAPRRRWTHTSLRTVRGGRGKKGSPGRAGAYTPTPEPGVPAPPLDRLVRMRLCRPWFAAAFYLPKERVGY
jgi:hypothetical protein